MRRAQQLALRAINEQGVARYNAGDIQGCVNVYANCVAQILSLSENEGEDKITADARRTLTKGLSECSNSNGDVDTQAWALRGALDQFIQHRYVSTTSSTSTSSTSTSSTSASTTSLSFLRGLPASFQQVNDSVMGGRSTSSIRHDPNIAAAIFSGTLSIQNNGGFASVRAANVNIDLSRMTCVRVTAASSTGGTYKLRLQDNNSSMNAVSYSHDFDVGSDGTFRTCELPLDRFVPTWRGQRQEGYTLNKRNVSSVGIMLVSSKLSSSSSSSSGGGGGSGLREGSFELVVRVIEGR